MSADHDQSPPDLPGDVASRRRPATAAEIKAIGHPLRLRILRLCLHEELTNKQLADRFGTDPGTMLYHVRQLLGVGLLVAAPVRTGARGALEKPYRATGLSWWLSAPLGNGAAGTAAAPLEAFMAELHEAGPAALRTYARFTLHLSDEDVEQLDRRLLEVLDEYVATDDTRRDRPVYGGIVALHRVASGSTVSAPRDGEPG